MRAAAHTPVGNFLRKVPQPAYVMADETRLNVPQRGAKWRELVSTISSLEPTKLIAYASDGTALRAITLESDSDTKASSAEPDSDSGTLQTLARLLADAYEKSGKAQQPILDRAMEFIERLSARLASTEAELERVRRAYARLLEDTAHERAQAIEASAAASGDEGDVVTQAIAALASGAMQAHAEQAQPANGKRPIAAKVGHG